MTNANTILRKSARPAPWGGAILVAGLLFGLGASAPAHAATITGTFTIAFSDVTDNNSSNEPSIATGNNLTIYNNTDTPQIVNTLASYSSSYKDYTLTENITTQNTTSSDQPLFVVEPASSCHSCGSEDTASAILTIDFAWTLNGKTIDDSVSATYTADYLTNTDSLDFSSTPLVVTFDANDVLDVNLINAADWDIAPEISFDLDPTPVPEPASLALLSGALVGFGLIRRRRRAS